MLGPREHPDTTIAPKKTNTSSSSFRVGGLNVFFAVSLTAFMSMHFPEGKESVVEASAPASSDGDGDALKKEKAEIETLIKESIAEANMTTVYSIVTSLPVGVNPCAEDFFALYGKMDEGNRQWMLKMADFIEKHPEEMPYIRGKIQEHVSAKFLGGELLCQRFLAKKTAETQVSTETGTRGSTDEDFRRTAQQFKKLVAKAGQ